MDNRIKLLALTILAYGTPILLWSTLPFTKDQWGSFTSDFIFNYLFYGNISYSSMGIIFDIFIIYCFYILFKKEENIENNRVYLICTGISKIWKWIFLKNLSGGSEISKEEKVSLLFYLVKLFFTPVMVGFLIGNMTSVIQIIPAIESYFNPENWQGFKIIFLALIFPAMLYLILLIDTVIFVFGYLFESKKLNNIVKSVEPTALGWLVAIMCYPPINTLTANVFGWYSNDFSNFGNSNLNLIASFLSIILFIIYVWATVALGFKASNLTNRGIVTKGPYKYIRHPAYISKNLSWWIMGIPFIINVGFLAVFSLSAWTFIYFLRALTEERHLSQDPDYIAYMNKVKYKFIPGIY